MLRAILVFGLVAGLLVPIGGQILPKPAPFPVALENKYVRVFVADSLKRGQITVLPVEPGREAVLVAFIEKRTSDNDNANGSNQSIPDIRVGYLKTHGNVMGVGPPDKSVNKTIWVELKSKPPSTPFALDAVALDPQHNHVLFENKKVRVVRIHFAPGEQGPLVDKRPRVIILLSDMHAQVVKPGGQPEPRDGTAGTIYWSLGGSQATINRNETPLDNIVIELKGK